MINGKNVLAITLARGGSKSIPKKNIMFIAGKPLIAYTIEEVKKSQFIDCYIVSTDSTEIQEVSLLYGAEAPFLRPAELSTDTSPPQDGLFHAVQEYEKRTERYFEYIVEVMCTNPLKVADDIDQCLLKLEKTGSDSVISVNRLFDHHPARIKKIVDDRLVCFCCIQENERTRRQDFHPEAYIRNGSIYAFKRDTLMVHRSKWGKVIRPYIMPPERSINIDEPTDVYLAEHYLTRKKKIILGRR
jgi:CMP-N-acetylneuraminic acid synthetase